MKIYFNHKEELWNSWSHGAGIVLGLVVGTVFLVWCGWARNGWMNSKKKQVENIDLMQEIYQYVEFPMLNFKLEKVHGHDGLLGNELADSLAANNRKKFDDLIYKNDIILCNILDK